jgi:hypothetical protein
MSKVCIKIRPIFLAKILGSFWHMCMRKHRVEIEIYRLDNPSSVVIFRQDLRFTKREDIPAWFGHIWETPKVGRWYNFRGELDAARHWKAENYVQKTRNVHKQNHTVALFSFSLPRARPGVYQSYGRNGRRHPRRATACLESPVLRDY